MKHRLHPYLADHSDCTLMLQFNISCVDEKYVNLKVIVAVASISLLFTLSGVAKEPLFYNYITRYMHSADRFYGAHLKCFDAVNEYIPHM